MSLLADVKTTNSLSCEEYINLAIKYCETYGSACAAWKATDSSDIQLIIDFSGGRHLDEVVLENLHDSFLFSPFDKSKDTLHIQGDLRVNISKKEVEAISNDKAEHFNRYLEKELHEVRNRKTINEILKVKAYDSSEFLSLVKTCLYRISQNQFQKVVPSRCKEIELKETLNCGRYFKDLCSNYKSAFVSLVFDEKCGLWLGASPELLLQTKENIFKTVSLAGTQKYEGQSLSEIAWTQKEIEEHAFVSRYVINCFKKIRLREFEEMGPKTVKAGNLLHLKTQFSVDMISTNFPDLGSVMLELLHPTSAICGMPLEPSLEFLLSHEKYDREYFSGYLGPVGFENSTTLHVNLRCMKVSGKNIRVFAGAGVTEDSQPEKEWLETEMKMNTLLNIFE